TWILPNGADAPGKVLPSSLVPMKVLTTSAGSAGAAAACATGHVQASTIAAIPVRVRRRARAPGKKEGPAGTGPRAPRQSAAGAMGESETGVGKGTRRSAAAMGGLPSVVWIDQIEIHSDLERSKLTTLRGDFHAALQHRLA